MKKHQRKKNLEGSKVSGNRNPPSGSKSEETQMWDVAPKRCGEVTVQ